MESDSHEPGPGSGAADHGLVANLSAAELERLSAHYGPEVYSMVEDEKHREIIERNSAMRVRATHGGETLEQDAVKELGKSKLKARSKVDVAGDFITVPRESARRDNLGKPNKGGKAKRLRSVLGLKHFYNSLGRMHVSFWVMLDVELAKLLEWLAPSEEEREAKEMVLLQLEMVVAALFPKAQMHVFGSYVTGLSLPGGDIDVCIEGHGDELVSLKLLVYALSRMDLLHSFECVFNTPVPVVKAIDKHTGTAPAHGTKACRGQA
ncbi:topoisomerase-related nucleotidyltransferase [Babesia caballi]|uniref:Topoisomerase-related nucleotidyltransferase n=1 Tax=Babesia caballi TaxID=5871 RepID=A0AAV4LMT6_BABCB|nr:topoisomerase-related nucleotidyltransferase [Babesia caballi]